jgi:hypothetical protein
LPIVKTVGNFFLSKYIFSNFRFSFILRLEKPY